MDTDGWFFHIPQGQFIWNAVQFAIVIAAIILALQAYNSRLNKIPGPWTARFTNLPLKLAVLSGRRVHYVHSIHQAYGPIARIAPNEVAVNDPAAHRQIHGVAGGYEKAQMYKYMVTPPREGIFSMSNKAHTVRRRLLTRPFSKTNLRQYWEPAVHDKIRLMMSCMSKEAMNGPVDVLKWSTFMASDVSTRLMFGQDFATLEHGEVSPYVRALGTTVMGRAIGFELPLVRWIGARLPFRSCRALFDVDDTLAQYGQLAVDNLARDPHRANVFAQMAVEAGKGGDLDSIDVQCEAQNLIVAGTETTSITLTYLIWAVLSRPDLRRDLGAEVGSLPVNFTDTDVERLELLDNIIKETLRLYGAAPGGLPRVVPGGGASLGKFFIPEGTIVSTQAFSIHRDATLFPDPLVFMPERWKKSSEFTGHSVSDTAAAAYTPFGTGARNCLGIHLANMSLRLAVAEFFRRFPQASLAESTTPESMEFENFFLVAPVSHKCEILLSR